MVTKSRHIKFENDTQLIDLYKLSLNLVSCFKTISNYKVNLNHSIRIVSLSVVPDWLISIFKIFRASRPSQGTVNGGAVSK